MSTLLAALERLSLRRRFLIPSLLAVVVIAGITGVLVVESRRQSALLERVARQDLPDFERHSRLYLALSAHHMAVFDLLREGPQRLSEEELYDHSRSRLLAMRGTLGELRGLVERNAILSSASAVGAAADAEDREVRLQRNVLSLTEDYMKSVTAAIELATVDVAYANEQLATANQRFLDMNRAYVSVLEAESSDVRDEIARSIEASARRGFVVMSGALVLCGLLMAIASALARVLARSLEAQVEILVGIGARATPIPGGAESSEVGRIARAIDAFREVIDKLRTEVARRREAEGHLRIYEEVVRSTGEAVAIADHEGRIIEVNAAYERALGVTREEALGAQFFGSIAGENPEAARAAISTALGSEGHWTGEILQRRKSGESFPSWTTANTVGAGKDRTGHLVSVSRDITALKQNEQALQKLAFFDPLTGLANRALLNDRARIAIANARRKGEKVAALYVDLDRFKFVNDTLGHPAGDKLLVEVAHRLSEQVRATDTLARLGGDEFVILLPSVESAEDALDIGQRAIACISQPMDLGEGPAFVGASVGIAFFPDDAQDVESLHKCADLAMYEAKQTGRGQWRRFSPEMVDRARRRLTLSTEIDVALERGDFQLHYQPIVDLANGEVVGAEALIRWPQADGTYIPPATFIPHAEEVGLIKRIDQWVLERACADAGRWQRQIGRPMDVSVNLSAISLQQAELPAQLAAVLERTGLPRERLRIEITETAVIANPQVAIDVLRTIADSGVRVSLDDFGTGYSSLHYLVQFPIDRIKLDASFVRRIGDDPASEEIIRSLLALAKRLEIGVVAEGVEDLRQKNFLTEAGCGYVQGFYVAKALPLGEFTKLAGSRRLEVSELRLTA